MISQKRISEQFFLEWNKKYNEAKADLNDREAKITKAMDELETDMELLGITGVEGKLSFRSFKHYLRVYRQATS